MDDKLLKRYREYARTEEASAVLFVKMHLAEAKGHWVDVVNCRRCEMSSNNLHFRFVVGGLFSRVLHPKYPPKTSYTINGKFDEHGYSMMARAITWETAHNDISQQKSKGTKPLKFEVTGVSYDKNEGSTSYFRDDAPLEIRALAQNINDRTDPLWDKAMQHINGPEFVYEVREAKIIRHGV